MDTDRSLRIHRPTQSRLAILRKYCNKRFCYTYYIRLIMSELSSLLDAASMAGMLYIIGRQTYVEGYCRNAKDRSVNIYAIGSSPKVTFSLSIEKVDQVCL